MNIQNTKFEIWINEAILFLSGILLLISILVTKNLVIGIICFVALLIVGVFLFIRFRDRKVDFRIDEVQKNYDKKNQFENKNKSQINVFDDFGSVESNKNFEEDLLEVQNFEPSQTVNELQKNAEFKIEHIESKEEVKKIESKELSKIIVDSSQSYLNPKQELQKILQSVVEFVFNITFANSVILFWVKNNNKDLSLESIKTNSNKFVNKKLFPIEDDVLSNSVKSGKGIFLKNLDGIDLPFYTDEKICSLIALPIMYDEKSPIAILSIDSKDFDAFGDETIETLSQCAKLISDLFVAESDKLVLWDDKKFFSIHLKMLELLRQHAETPQLVNLLVDKIAEIINWDAISVVIFNNELSTWEVVNTRSRMPGKYFVVKQTIDLKQSLVGKSIIENEIKITEDSTVIRFMMNENELDVARGKVVASIPISTSTKCYGALVIEKEKSNSFINEELINLQKITTTVASSIELQDANEIISQHVIYDELPNVVTYRHFVHRLDEEVRRANDLNLDLTLALFALHTFEEIENRFGKNSIPKVMASLSNFIVSHKRPYDLIGRFDKNILGVMLVHTPANEGYLWGEKIRSTIAENKIKIDDKNFSTPVTVSICGLKDGMIVDDILKASNEVLDKAIRVGGNLVSVY